METTSAIERDELMTGLTIKQEKFCQGLFSGLSQREAYKQAFNATRMKDKTIDETASRLAKERKVSARLDELSKQVADRNGITADFVLNGIRAIALKAEIKESDTLKAYELLGKHLKLFTEKIEQSGETTVNTKSDLSHLSTEQIRELIKSGH